MSWIWIINLEIPLGSTHTNEPTNQQTRGITISPRGSNLKSFMRQHVVDLDHKP